MAKKQRSKKMVTKKKTKKEAQVTRLGHALRALGGLGGGFLGNMVGESAYGKASGRSLGAALSKWLGSGDYRVAQNTLITPSGSIPSMHNTGQSVVVRHKEYIGAVKSAIGYTVQYSLPLNPGLEQTFPWLSRIAANFQEYKIKGMVFHYIPSSGTAISGASPALGTVMLQTSYRSTDSPPATKLEMLNEYWATENVPAESFVHPIECDPKENPFNIQYVRTNTLPSTENQLMYDLGVTHIATAGQLAAGNVLGDLWVTYDVELKKPQVASNVTSTTNFFSVTYSSSALPNYLNILKGVAPDTRSNMGVTFDGTTVTFAPGITGSYCVNIYFTGSFTQFDASASNTFTNCVRVPTYVNPLAPTVNSYYTVQTVGVGTNSCALSETSVKIDDPSVAASITFGAITWTNTGNVAVSVVITQIA